MLLTSFTTARSTWSLTLLMALLVVASIPARSAELQTNEGIKLRVLRTAFPGATISRSTSPLEDLSLKLECCKELPLNDAFKDEHLYEIVAPATKAEEDPASDVNEPEKPLSTKRLVRLQVYRLRSQDAGDPLFVAIVNYWLKPATRRTAAKLSAGYCCCRQMVSVWWTASMPCRTLSECLHRLNLLMLATVAWRSCFWLRTILLQVKSVSISKCSTYPV